jgi:excisionase family DNA binding protein
VIEPGTTHPLQQSPPATVSASPYLVVEEVAERLRCSKRTIHELTRTEAIPHRRLPGSRRCLFLPVELEAWEAGAELEARELAGGGRIVTVSENGHRG